LGGGKIGNFDSESVHIAVMVAETNSKLKMLCRKDLMSFRPKRCVASRSGEICSKIDFSTRLRLARNDNFHSFLQSKLKTNNHSFPGLFVGSWSPGRIARRPTLSAVGKSCGTSICVTRPVAAHSVPR
jgi:hypothetical protein